VRVLLMFPGALGDLLLLAPAAAALARDGMELELSVQRSLVPLARCLLGCRIGPPVDGMTMATLFGPEPAPALASWVCGAGRAHAFLGSSARGREAAHRLRELGARGVRLHAVVRDDGAEHASRAYARMLEVTSDLQAPDLALDAQAPPTAWACAPEKRLVLHPGAGSAAKRWGREGFVRVADAWRERGGEVLVVCGPAEEESVAFWRAAGHRMATGLALMETAVLLASAPLYVGNDSGVSHLAAALRRRGVVLFGPTRPERWRPLGGELGVLRFADAGQRALAAAILHRLGAAGARG